MGKRKQAAVSRDPKLAAIYCRVSSDKQKDNYSRPEQERLCREFAARQGWTVSAVYHEVHSAEDLWERPEMTRLRDALRGGAYDVIVCLDLDRFIRDQNHLGVMVDEAIRHRAEIWFVHEGKLDSTPVGRFLFSALAFKAELERLDIAKRTDRGKVARARKGRLMAAPIPLYGYQWRAAIHVTTEDGDGTKEISRYAYDEHPDQAAIIRRIFREASEGRTLYAIAQSLNAESIPTAKCINKEGERVLWTVAQLSRMLREPRYTGEAVAFASRGAKPERERIPIDDDVIPALVDRAVFDAVGERLKRNRIEAMRAGKDRQATNPELTLLRAGFVKCRQCGRGMTVHKRGNWKANKRTEITPDRLIYRCINKATGCSHNVSVKKLDGEVWAKLAEMFRDPSTVFGTFGTPEAAADNTAQELDRVERLLADVIKKHSRGTERLLEIEDEYTYAEMKDQLAALGVQRRELSDRADALRSQQVATGQHQDRLEAAFVWCAERFASMGTVRNSKTPPMTYADRRKLLADLGAVVWVQPASVDPNRWTFEGSAPVVIDPEALSLLGRWDDLRDRVVSQKPLSLG